MALSKGEKRVMRWWRKGQPYVPPALQASGSVGLGALSLLAERPLSQFNMAVLVLSVAVVGIGTVLAVNWQRRRSDLVLMHGRLEKETALLAEHVSKSAKHMLHELLKSLDMESPEYRASLFIPRSEGQEGHRLAARFCANPKLSAKGITSIGRDEGAVTRAYHEMQFHVEKLPKRRDYWENRMTSEFKIAAERSKSLRMQSRSYAGIQVTLPDGASERTVGVLLIESEHPEGVKPEHLDELRGTPHLRLMAAHCALESELDSITERA